MIPVKIALRNFMCYHDSLPPLYFDGFHIACLCGDNGNGKSALLDAITWALWGKARAHSDDDLIRLGEMEMEVEFEFTVAGEHYRVIRKRRKGTLKRAGETLLELQVAGPDGFAPVGGNTIRETEARIVQTLRMDYQTFINSALLLQGRANEFSLKSPGKRKEVLGNVLGLSFYDEVEKAARNRSKGKELTLRSLMEEVSRIDAQLAEKEKNELDRASCESTLSQLASDLKEQESALNDLRQVRGSLKLKEEEFNAIESQIQRLMRQIEYVERQIKDHTEKIQACRKVLSSYEDNRTLIEKHKAELELWENDLVKKREENQNVSNRVHYLDSANAQLKREMEELKSKVDLLADEEAECPLCGAELGLEGRARIRANYEHEGREKAEQYRANLAEKRRKEDELRVLRQEMTKIENAILAKSGQYERQAESLERDRAESERLIPLEEESLIESQKAVEESRSVYQETLSRKETLAEDLRCLPQVERNLLEIEKSCAELHSQERLWQERLAGVRANLEICARLEARKHEIDSELALTTQEKEVYDELALAFGKKGIQAMIIESAIPEIEAEANSLLARMTDNRMHLRIESQRDTKKGDTVETLDIRISDELGVRGYELFSGGEAFRVDFALRIALSRLLAKRAGAPLPTLFIDEGFGTQDASGRGKLIEAINCIQNDFEKILVITHIDELKEAFPVRIEVTKTEDGSMFSIM